MARGILGKAIRGAAAVAVPGLLEEHKAQILAQRDKTLKSFQVGERKAGQEFRTSERVAGEEARAEEGALDRASREKVAKTRSGSDGKGKLKVVGSFLVNDVTGEKMEMPESQKDLRALAATLAKADVESNANKDLENPLSAKQLTDKYMREWSSQIKAAQKKPAAVADGEMPKNLTAAQQKLWKHKDDPRIVSFYKQRYPKNIPDWVK